MPLIGELHQKVIAYHQKIHNWVSERAATVGLSTEEDYYIYLNQNEAEAAHFMRLLQQHHQLPFSIDRSTLAREDYPVPFVIHLEGKIEYANQAALRLFGVQNEAAMLGRMVLDLLIKEDRETAIHRFKMIHETGAPIWPTRQRVILDNGDTTEVMISSMPIYFEGKDAIQAWVLDIGQAMRTEATKDRQLALLEGLNQASMILVGSDGRDEAIERALQLILELFKADRVYLFQNFIGLGQEVYTKQIIEVTQAGVTPQIDNPDLQLVSYDDMGFERWEALFKAGQGIHGLVSDLPESERPLLEMQDILSVMAMPVPTGGTLWGFLGIDDCQSQRQWLNAEVSAFRNVGLALGNFLERTKANERLSYSEDALQKVQKIGRIGSFVYDLVSGDWYFSEMFRRMFGPIPQNPHEFNRKARKILAPDAMRKIQRKWHSLVDARGHRRIKGTVAVRFGKRIKHFYYVLENEINKEMVSRIYGSLQDITERVESEQAMNENRIRLLNTQRIGKIGSWEYDFATQKIWWSDVVFDLLELPSGAISSPQAAFTQLVKPTDLERLRATIKHILLTKEPLDFVQEFTLSDGRIKYFQVYGELEVDPQGQARILAGTCLDITEKREAEYRQKVSDSNLRALLESTEDVIFSINRQYEIIALNQSFQQLMRDWLGREVVIGTNIVEVIANHPRMLRPHWKIASMQAALAGQSAVKQTNIRMLNRQVKSYAFSLNPILSEEKEVVGVAILGKDITFQMENERKIRHLNLVLEKRVAKRTEELEKINKELETFAYSVSHDLRSPLRHLSGYSSLLSRRAVHLLDPESLEYLQFMGAASKKMNRFIEDLLEYSRLGRKAMTCEWVRPQTMIQSAMDFLVRSNDKVQIQWESFCEQEVYADPLLLETILTNLLSNAVKYRNSSGVCRISIETKSSHQGVILSVSDDGIGFDMEYHDRIFGIFQRLHSDEEYEGVGIGLANVQRIMHRHGGSIRGESTLGNGATFLCYFPSPA